MNLVSLVELEDAMKSLGNDLAHVQSMMETFCHDNVDTVRDFVAGITEFVSQSRSALDALNVLHVKAKERFVDSVKFYAEAIDTATPESFFSTFSSFCALYSVSTWAMRCVSCTGAH